jgi:hypothetical protein
MNISHRVSNLYSILFISSQSPAFNYGLAAELAA